MVAALVVPTAATAGLYLKPAYVARLTPSGPIPLQAGTEAADHLQQTSADHTVRPTEEAHP